MYLKFIPQIAADRGQNRQNSRPAASLRVTSACRTWPSATGFKGKGQSLPERIDLLLHAPDVVGLVEARRTKTRMNRSLRHLAWPREQSALHEEIDTAVVEIVASPNDLQLAPFQRVHQDRLGRAAQPRDGALDVLAYRHVQHLLAVSIRLRSVLRLQGGWDDRLDHLADAAGEGGILFHNRQGGIHGAAALVAEHKNERYAQLSNGVLDAAKRHGVDRVPGIADDEQLSKAPTEQKLGRHTRVGAGDQDRKRRLALGNLQTAFVVQAWVVHLCCCGCLIRGVRHKLSIAVLEPLERLIGRQVGCLAGGVRGCESAGAQGQSGSHWSTTAPPQEAQPRPS